MLTFSSRRSYLLELQYGQNIMVESSSTSNFVAPRDN
jgi:hypothetical protein